MSICDLQAYMELTRDLEPMSVLDAGMIMRRFALVSRRAANCVIPADVRLVGLDFSPDKAFPMESRIYDAVIPAEDFLKTGEDFFKTGEEFEFSALFTQEFPPGVSPEALLGRLARSCRYFITLHDNHVYLPRELLAGAQSITIDRSRYVLTKRT